MSLKLPKLVVTSALLIISVTSGPYVFGQTQPKTVQPALVMGEQSSADVQRSTAPASPTPQQQSEPAQINEIRIGPGDLLEIRVFGVQDLTQDVRVSANGDINVPLIGATHVADLTQGEAEDLIAARLRDGDFMLDPHVSVFTKEYATQGVSVFGEVNHAGVFPLLGPRKLYDVISLAGGLTDKAGKIVTITHRDTPNDPIKVELSDEPNKVSSSNPAIMPGDTIVVAKAGIVYVVGDVGRPAGFIMDNNGRMTVLQAVALAGGTNSTAAVQNAKVIRRTPSGIQEIPMPLKKILSAKSDDVQLQPEDVLFVPRSATKSAARRGAESILQITTGIAIYRR